MYLSAAKASQLGLQPFEENGPLDLQLNPSQEDIETALRAIYRQVLGNAHVMESEVPIAIESQFRSQQIGVREFVRQLAKSDLYRSRFFDNCPRYRAIELNFKHLLGRAPENYAEMVEHSNVLDREGFEAEIDSYLDSDEYQDAFGESIVPYYRGHKTRAGRGIVGFPNLFQLLRGPSSSDKASAKGITPQLTESVIAEKAKPVTFPSTVWSYNGETDIDKLLQAVLTPSFFTVASEVRPISSAPSELLQECQERDSEIAELRQKLNELKPGARFVESRSIRWSGYTSLDNTDDSAKLASLLAELDAIETDRLVAIADVESYAEKQKMAVSTLQREIDRARSLALLGENQLSKWRSRAFF